MTDYPSREIEFDGVTYVFQYHNDYTYHSGNPSGFWDRMDEKERHEVQRRMIEHLLETGYLIRKSDLEKRNSIYKKDELFYGL
jgi:hypothetical protein